VTPRTTHTLRKKAAESRGRRVGQTRLGSPASKRGPSVTPVGGNVFADLGYARGEAKNLKLRSDLMSALERIISDMTQVEAAALLGVTQPRVSDLKSGRIGSFTIDALVNMLAHAGVETRLVIKPPKRSA
jgi:predicted XRE-type DNA-binding protein